MAFQSNHFVQMQMCWEVINESLTKVNEQKFLHSSIRSIQIDIGSATYIIFGHLCGQFQLLLGHLWGVVFLSLSFLLSLKALLFVKNNHKRP